MTQRADSVRIALGFIAVFFLLGIHLPYWPVWLQSRGLEPEEIGILLALGPWMRVVANPLVGRVADAAGSVRRIAILLALGGAAAYVGFAVTEGFWVFLPLAVLLGVTFNPLIPLTDAVAVRTAARGGADYGRLRRWGSASFIVASVAGGRLLETQDDFVIVWVLLGAMLLLAATMGTLPRSGGGTPPALGAVAPRLLRRIDVRWFLLTIFGLHASHAMLYGFGTAYWRGQGIDESIIGWLWAVGVVAEIVLFSVGLTVARRLSATGLLAVAGIGGLIRWPVLASTVSLPWLFGAQLLHAATFAALHLGAMEFIRVRIGADATARATTTYSAVAGVALGVGLPISGWVYDDLGGRAYLLMAVCSAAGLLASLWLRRHTQLNAPRSRNDLADTAPERTPPGPVR